MSDAMYESLGINTSESEGKLTIEFYGQSDAREPATILDPIFQNVLNNLPSEITLEFTKLEFMNSSTMPPLAQFIIKLDEKKVKTTIVYDDSMKWQNSVFGVLKKLTEDSPYISVIGR